MHFQSQLQEQVGTLLGESGSGALLQAPALLENRNKQLPAQVSSSMHVW